jgi:hypothetical protein
LPRRPPWSSISNEIHTTLTKHFSSLLATNKFNPNYASGTFLGKIPTLGDFISPWDVAFSNITPRFFNCFGCHRKWAISKHTHWFQAFKISHLLLNFCILAPTRFLGFHNITPLSIKRENITLLLKLFFFNITHVTSWLSKHHTYMWGADIIFVSGPPSKICLH